MRFDIKQNSVKQLSFNKKFKKEKMWYIYTVEYYLAIKRMK